MQPKKIVVVVIDRLRAAAVGAYGAAWCDTPAMDYLASESILFDHALITSQRLDSLYRSYWNGEHPLAPAPRPSLPAQLAAAGYATTLLTDEPEVADHALAADFADHIRLPTPERIESAQSIAQTHLARFFNTAADALSALEQQEREQPSLLWLHTRGLAAPWDAPLELRDSLVEEDDPPPPRTAEVPRTLLPADFDPDELLGYTQAYSGQIMALDACLANFLHHLESSPLAGQTLLVFIGARGFPLGEHRRIGAIEELLYSEMIHVPWMMRFPDQLGRLVRSQALVQPSDLPLTLLDWAGIEVPAPTAAAASLLPIIRGDEETVHDRLCLTTSNGQRAMRTAAWHGVFPTDAAAPQLYVKPDDRWEFNEVADRLPQVTDELSQAAAQFNEAAQAGRLAELPPLEESLGESFH